MNAPANFTRLTMEQFATRLAAGDLSVRPLTDYIKWSDAEWINAAECAIDGEYDLEELEWMIQREQAFAAWQNAADAWGYRTGKDPLDDDVYGDPERWADAYKPAPAATYLSQVAA